MNSFKKLAVSLAYASSVMVAPLALAGVAHAQQLVVQCSNNQEVILLDQRLICDLNVDKLVSVNGGPFVEADTSADAAQATVGDTITWKIIVSNNSTEGLIPYGFVYVHDVLPSGVAYVNSSASAGNYITSGFFANYWYIPLLGGGEFPSTTLPATLTITSTSTATGLFKNTATLAKYDTGSCDGGCVYADGDPTNDSNDAWIDPSAKPVVLAASTELTNTGSGTAASIIAGGLIAATLAVSLYGRKQNKAFRISR